MTTSRVRLSVSPVPGLCRDITPESSAPATPTLPSARLVTSPSSKKPQVGFAQKIVSSSYRIPEADERYVMRAFATHASHCNTCRSPERAVRDGLPLCRSGTELAKDIGKYFFCWDGKPYSVIDRQNGERVQVEVPMQYSAVKGLFEALGKGLKFTNLKERERRPSIHQTYSLPSPSPYRTTTSGSYEIRPSNSVSRRHRSNSYTVQASKPVQYEIRSPDDYQEHSSRREKRGSLYHEDRQSKRVTWGYSR